MTLISRFEKREIINSEKCICVHDLHFMSKEISLFDIGANKQGIGFSAYF